MATDAGTLAAEISIRTRYTCLVLLLRFLLSWSTFFLYCCGRIVKKITILNTISTNIIILLCLHLNLHHFTNLNNASKVPEVLWEIDQTAHACSNRLNIKPARAFLCNCSVEPFQITHGRLMNSHLRQRELMSHIKTLCSFI